MTPEREFDNLTLAERELLWIYRDFASWYNCLTIENKRKIAAVLDDQRGRIVYELVREHWQRNGGAQ